MKYQTHWRLSLALISSALALALWPETSQSGYEFIWSTTDPNVSAQQFSAPGECIGDVDGDGANELLCNRQGAFLILDLASGYVEYTSPSVAGDSWTCRMADVDGDGYPEVVASRFGGSATSLFGVVDFLGIASAGPASGLGLQALQVSENPFRSSTVMEFGLARAAHVDLRIVDVQGRQIRTLRVEQTSAGTHKTVWDGRDDSGAPVAAGVYLYKLELNGGLAQSGKLQLIP